MKVLLLGAGGQLGRELASRAPLGATLVSRSHLECDITDPSGVRSELETSRPDAIINCAAYTAVDAAETEPRLAFDINAVGARNVGAAAANIDAHLIHISTDYVFDGHATVPYPVDAKPNPLNVYGASKLAGEEEILGVTTRAMIVRTGWLYASRGKNFVLTMIKAMRCNSSVRVVTDQRGCPTSARHLADALWACVAKTELAGLFHWSNAGEATWYEFALAIAELGIEREILTDRPDVIPATSDEMRRPAKRPAYSVLDSSLLAGTLGMSQTPWRQSLAETMEEIPRE